MSEYQKAKIFQLELTTDTGVFNVPTLDLLNLYIIEDIYSFSLTGRIKFIDAGGLSEFGPFTGGEFFTITWGFPDGAKKTLKLYIYKINNITQTSGHFKLGAVVIDLFLVDEYFKLLNAKYHSYTYNEMKISDTIKTMCKEYCGISSWDRFEDCKEKLKFYYTGMKTPAENFKWLMKRSSGVVSKTPGYLLFNTTNNKWNFCTLEYLLSQSTHRMCEPPGDGYLYSFDTKNLFYINKIIEHTHKQPDKTSLKKLMKGRKLGFDQERKKFLDQKFSYDNALSKFTILGKKSLFQSSLKSDGEEFILEDEFKEEILDNMWYDNWIKQYCLQQTFSFIVNGHIAREPGNVIEVEWPSSSEDEQFNKQFIGKYLIKSITHQFGNSNDQFYVQKLVCIKNGYQDSDSSALVSAQKKHL